ncbi:DMT family transporter [bacterium M00.F.Ca.ET.228.01.1.1]|uniref:DMT family transporter n=1 Tax=Paraburkholderia phenoliruptrix TaxID=252970 RepID=UPI001092C384|nr:DMT family transporter [Paraburkholderia phenoliruptrix]TGP46418.1 DMT family transporter [bacterium M00.F.Ca.ET.228.01.1.1]TGS04357.1 DMT family transporter [bacterium M00.F.Ca.ET.191.01.1.1]TGU07712.1 DMT family transporter [bacterium M00.F.Ca.ET.155.01.1.1]MBW0448474.1 DMT family transporter [Paraburkholderia phenoliruptrix]MBW9100664.1 DMT family transporter [Paraburkholderia phenoliruptrix]
MRLNVSISDRTAQYQTIALILTSMFCFAVVDALGKAVALDYPANEVTFFRMLFGLVPAALVSLRGGSLGARVRNIDFHGQTIRALTLLGASGLFFAGLPYLPLSEAVAIVYSEAIFVVLLAPILLGERLLARNAIAALVGFIGVLLVVRPQGSLSNLIGPGLLLLSAFCGALSMIQIRKLKVSEDSSLTVLFFTAFGTAVTGLSLFFAWRTPTIKHLFIMATLATFATAGQLLFTIAVRRESAARLAPYTYTSIIWATLFGFFLWGETLALVPVVGIAAIVGSSIAVAVREEPPEGPAV